MLPINAQNMDLTASQQAVSGVTVVFRARDLSDWHGSGARGDGDLREGVA